MFRHGPGHAGCGHTRTNRWPRSDAMRRASRGRVVVWATAAVIAVLTALPELACAGAIEARDSSSIWFAGEITQDDVPRIKAAILAAKESSAESVSLTLDSPGGDVMAAIEIGRFVRANAVRTQVPAYEGARCYSACILIVMGGVHRIALANLGIHRPNFDESYFAGLSEQQARAEYQRLSAEVEAYLAEMGADPALFQQMMRVSSGRIRLLTPEEAEAFAIFGWDPSYQEWLRAKRAERLGLENFQKLEACEQSQEYQDYRDALSSRALVCIKQKITDGRTCFAEFHQHFPDPCASFRHKPQP